MSGSMMWGTDCNGCDPDLTYHVPGCPLAGELRGKLWLPTPEPVDWEQRASESATRIAELEADVALQRASMARVWGKARAALDESGDLRVTYKEYVEMGDILYHVTGGQSGECGGYDGPPCTGQRVESTP